MIARRSDDAVFTAWATAAGAPGVAQFAAHRRSHASRQDVVARHTRAVALERRARRDERQERRHHHDEGLASERGRSPSPRAGRDGGLTWNPSRVFEPSVTRFVSHET